MDAEPDAGDESVAAEAPTDIEDVSTAADTADEDAAEDGPPATDAADEDAAADPAASEAATDTTDVEAADEDAADLAASPVEADDETSVEAAEHDPSADADGTVAEADNDTDDGAAPDTAAPDIAEPDVAALDKAALDNAEPDQQEPSTQEPAAAEQSADDAVIENAAVANQVNAGAETQPVVAAGEDAPEEDTGKEDTKDEALKLTAAASAKPSTAPPSLKPTGTAPPSLKPASTAPPGTARVARRRFRRSWTLTAAAAALIVAVGATIAASSGSKPDSLTAVTQNHPVQHQVLHPAPALHVVSVSPADGATGANGGGTITVTFDGKLAPGTPMPTVSPKITGTWHVQGNQAVFTPAIGYQPHTHVTVSIPAGMQSAAGVTAKKGGLLAAKLTGKFTTGTYSTLRLQQLLAQLGYLPLDWSSSDGTTIASDNANAQLQAAYSPPQGSFTFQGGYPSALTDQWHAGQSNELVTGAVMAFQSNHGLTMDGVAGPQVWQSLLKAVGANDRNPNGYTYAYVNQNTPQRLKVWHDGKQVLDTLANTGIPGRVTDDGTYPVYLRYKVTQMRGRNPDGSKYNDTVYWVSYFNGSDAIHYFPRGSYGYSQSLGCVEIQWDQAKSIWPKLTYGTLVTVTGPPGG